MNSWNFLKNKFRGATYSVRLFSRGVYHDILRFIFSQWFVRNRRFFCSCVMIPFALWAYFIEKPQYDKIHNNRSIKKLYVAEKLLHERGLGELDDDTYRHYSNYMRATYPR